MGKILEGKEETTLQIYCCKYEGGLWGLVERPRGVKNQWV